MGVSHTKNPSRLLQPILLFSLFLFSTLSTTCANIITTSPARTPCNHDPTCSNYCSRWSVGTVNSSPSQRFIIMLDHSDSFPIMNHSEALRQPLADFVADLARGFPSSSTSATSNPPIEVLVAGFGGDKNMTRHTENRFYTQPNILRAFMQTADLGPSRDGSSNVYGAMLWCIDRLEKAVTDANAQTQSQPDKVALATIVFVSDAKDQANRNSLADVRKRIAADANSKAVRFLLVYTSHPLESGPSTDDMAVFGRDGLVHIPKDTDFSKPVQWAYAFANLTTLIKVCTAQLGSEVCFANPSNDKNPTACVPEPVLDWWASTLLYLVIGGIIVFLALAAGLWYYRRSRRQRQRRGDGINEQVADTKFMMPLLVQYSRF